MKPGFSINGRLISKLAPPYIIAEISANHNGSIERAKEMILAAKNTGADAVKLQTYTAETITLNLDTPEFMIQDGLWSGQSLYSLYESAHTPWEWHKPLFDPARKCGITIFSSPFDNTAIDFLEDLNVPAYKIASFEAVDLSLVAYAASTGKPLIISTGMADGEEKIYYSIADTYEAAANSPHIEHLKANETEVLLLTDRIDEWLMSTLMQFKGKALINVAKEELEESAKKPRVTKEKQEIIDKMKKSLDARVADVIASNRLVDSAACLVLSKNEPGAQLKRILEASGQTFEDSKPVFEVNLKHKLIKKLGSMSGKEFSNFSEFLFDYAVIAEGGTPKDPAKYLRQLDKYLG